MVGHEEAHTARGIGVLKSFNVYSAYFAQFLKARLEYQGDFFAGIAANFFVAFTGLLFLLFLMDGEVVEGLGGWGRDEVFFIYGYSMLPMAVFSTFAPNLYDFGNRYVIEGEFDRVLTRPLNSLFQVLFESFNLEAFGSLLVGFGLVLYSGSALGLSFSLVDFAWLIVSGLSGGIILISVFVFLASCSFHFEDRIGIAPPFYNLIQFGRYPLPIFHTAVQFVLSFVVPFAFASFYPATHFLERDAFAAFCYASPLVALITFGVAYGAWNFGVSRYASTGS